MFDNFAAFQHATDPMSTSVSSWSSDHLTGMSRSYLPIGVDNLVYGNIGEPVSDQLFFAGEVRSRSKPTSVFLCIWCFMHLVTVVLKITFLLYNRMNKIQCYFHVIIYGLVHFICELQKAILSQLMYSQLISTKYVQNIC